MGKYFKSSDHSIKITPSYGVIPMAGMEGVTAEAQGAVREKQEMRWKRIIKARLKMDRQHIILVDINRRKVNCSLYALGLTKDEKRTFTELCNEVINDKNNLIW